MESFVATMNTRIATIRKLGCYRLIIFLSSLLVPLSVEARSDIIEQQKPCLQLLRTDSALRQPAHIDLPITAYDAVARSEMIKRISDRINIYDMPYSRTAHYPNYRRLWHNTGVLCGAGIVALGVLESLPENATNWNRMELNSVPMLERWGNHVKKIAHWDGDSPIFNYILHPYGGAAYYMSARSVGFNMKWSAVYCFCISTFFWEYGVEAFMEIPSIQDLVITPVAGTLLGECFYKLKRQIVDDDYTLFGSSLLGNVVAYVIDPVNEVIGLFAGNPCRSGKHVKRSETEISFMPVLSNTVLGVGCGFTMNVVF